MFGFFNKKPDNLIGETLDKRYQITKRLGAGGFGDTYLAVDLRSKNNLQRVIKHLQPKGLSSSERDYVLPKLREMFEREKTVLEALGEAHPSKQIPRMMDHFEQWNEFFYVQEFIKGETLDDRGHGYMSQRSEANVKLLLVEILEVLAFVHQHKVVHRDLKPENIMRRTADQKIVLIDFGAVKDLSNIGLNRNNQPRSSLIIGTPGYMSPEQEKGQPQLASDVYAIGALGLHALTGESPTDLLNTHTLAFEWMHKVTVSPEFAAILNKMVTYRAVDRYGSAVEALQALQGITSPPVKFTPTPPPKVVVDDPFVEPVKYEPTIRVVANPQKERERLEAERYKQEQLQRQQEQERLEAERRRIQRKQERERLEAERRKQEQAALAEAKRRELTLDLGNGIKLELVRVPAGSFMMGGNQYDDEKPIHRVNVPEFLMGKYQVTQAQYEAVMGQNPSHFKGKQNPVEQVSWNDAQEFCKKLSQKTGRKVKLPSEAQWEYACRAGSTGKYCFGDHVDQLGKYAWYDKNSDYKTHPVGEKLANAWGLYDMHGNVWEWCEDVWHENYNGAPTDGSAWNAGGEANQKVVRGGSWDGNDPYCRSADRGRNYLVNWVPQYRVPFRQFF